MTTPAFEEDDDYFGFIEARFEAALNEADDILFLFDNTLEETGDWTEEGF